MNERRFAVTLVTCEDVPLLPPGGVFDSRATSTVIYSEQSDAPPASVR